MRTRKLLFILWAFLLVMVSCNKGDDSILEEASQIEATVGLVSAVNNQSDFSSEYLVKHSDNSFAINYKLEGKIVPSVTFDYCVNTAHTPIMNPNSVSWTINDGSTFTSPSIQNNFNFNTDYNVTVDVELSDGILFSSSFCFRLISPIHQDGDNFSPSPSLVLCPDSDAEIAAIWCPGCGGGASFAYIFP